MPLSRISPQDEDRNETGSRWPISVRQRAGLWALAAGFVLLWLATLAGRSLISSDEGRYASLSLAMLQSGDWLTPRLNGLLYFEKPPLQYWAGATFMWLFGVNEFAARLWPGLAGLATVGLVGYTAARLWGPRSGLNALFICAATAWIAINSHFLSLDAGLCGALTLVLCALLLAEHAGLDTLEGERWILAAWVGIGLGTLSKGPVAVFIPAASLLGHSLWRRDFSVWTRLRWFTGISILYVVAMPWFILVSLRNPDFASFFFIHEHLQRYLTAVHHRDGDWWYFVPFLLAGLLPWTGALPWLLRPRRDDFARSFLLVWVIVVFVFFSSSSSKLPSYILPMFPALALIAAHELEFANARALTWILAVPTLAWVTALFTLSQANRLFAPGTPQAAIDALQSGVGIAGAMFLVATGIAFVLLRRNRFTAALATVAVANVGAVLIVMQSHDEFGQSKSADRIAKVLATQIGSDAPIFAVRDYEHTLPFYLRRPVVLVDYRDEFEFGESHEPLRWIPSLDAFVTRWRSAPHAAAYMKRPTFEELRHGGLEMRVVFEDSRRMVVVKP